LIDLARNGNSHIFDQGEPLPEHPNGMIFEMIAESDEVLLALEHHFGITCDCVEGLVEVPCIERNGFDAIKSYTAVSLAVRRNGDHFMLPDSCIAAMKQTGLEMSEKFKETSLGGLAVSITEC
jgi:L-serine deaminase